jgi:hypothetical protein
MTQWVGLAQASPAQQQPQSVFLSNTFSLSHRSGMRLPVPRTVDAVDAVDGPHVSQVRTPIFVVPRRVWIHSLMGGYSSTRDVNVVVIVLSQTSDAWVHRRPASATVPSTATATTATATATVVQPSPTAASANPRLHQTPIRSLFNDACLSPGDGGAGGGMQSPATASRTQVARSSIVERNPSPAVTRSETETQLEMQTLMEAHRQQYRDRLHQHGVDLDLPAESTVQSLDDHTEVPAHPSSLQGTGL